MCVAQGLAEQWLNKDLALWENALEHEGMRRIDWLRGKGRHS